MVLLTKKALKIVNKRPIENLELISRNTRTIG
jgi:hypothetical protein